MWKLLGAHGLKDQAQPDTSTLFRPDQTQPRRVLASTGALFALMVTYRKQRVNEQNSQPETTRLYTERFTTSVSQLGDTNNAVRLGGVHALAHIADDAPHPRATPNHHRRAVRLPALALPDPPVPTLMAARHGRCSAG